MEHGEKVRVVFGTRKGQVASVYGDVKGEESRFRLKFEDNTVVTYPRKKFVRLSDETSDEAFKLAHDSKEVSKNSESGQDIKTRIIEILRTKMKAEDVDDIAHRILETVSRREEDSGKICDSDTIAESSPSNLFRRKPSKSSTCAVRRDMRINVKDMAEEIHEAFVEGTPKEDKPLSLSLQRNLYMAQMTAQQRAISVLMQQRKYIEKQRSVLPLLIRRTKRAGEQMFGTAATWLKMWDKMKVEPLRERERKLRSRCADLDAHLATVQDELDHVMGRVHTVVAPELIRGLNRYDATYENIKKENSSCLRRLQTIADAANAGGSFPRQKVAYTNRHKRLQSSQRFRASGREETADKICYRQSIHCFLSLYARARGTLKTLENHLNVWADKHHGVAIMGQLKRPERVFQKAYENYLGDFSCVRDIARGSIQFKSVRDLCECLDDICNVSNSVDVLRVKPRLAPSFDASSGGGYRDVLINLCFRDLEPPLNTFIVEVQLHLEALLKLKHADMGGHKTYSIARELHVFDDDLICPTISKINRKQLKGLAQGIVQTLNLCHLRIGAKEVRALIDALKQAGENSTLRSLIMEHINTGERETKTARPDDSLAVTEKVKREVKSSLPRHVSILKNAFESGPRRLTRKASSKHQHFDQYFRSIGTPMKGGETPTIAHFHAEGNDGNDNDSQSPSCRSRRSMRFAYLRCPENKSLTIPKGAFILGAYYGSAENFIRGKDVTKKVVELVRKKNVRQIFARPEIFGDPWYGMRKTLIVKVAVPFTLSKGSNLDCESCNSHCTAGIHDTTRGRSIGSLPCSKCGAYFCLSCVAGASSWTCEQCSHGTRSGMRRLLRRESLDSALSQDDLDADVDDDDANLRIDGGAGLLSTVEGFLRKKGQGDKLATNHGYRRRWLMLRNGRLSWSLEPGTPMRSFVHVRMYRLVEGPGVTSFGLILKPSFSGSGNRLSVELKSETVGDRNRWTRGLRAHIVAFGGTLQQNPTTTTRTSASRVGKTSSKSRDSKNVPEGMTEDDHKKMWILARELFSHPPFSNGDDSRYASVKAQLRSIYGKDCINKKNKPRLKSIAINRGAETNVAADDASKDAGETANLYSDDDGDGLEAGDSLKSQISETMETEMKDLGFTGQKLEADVARALAETQCRVTHKILSKILGKSKSNVLEAASKAIEDLRIGVSAPLRKIVAPTSVTTSLSPLTIPKVPSLNTNMRSLHLAPDESGTQARRLGGLNERHWAGIARGLEYGGRSLRHLSVKSSKITDGGLSSLLSYSHSSLLVSIDISRCSELTDMALGAVGARCGRNLQNVVANGCTSITDDGILVLAKLCPRLHYVSVEGIRNLTDDGVKHLIARCLDEMEKLDLKKISKLTDAAFEVLVASTSTGDKEQIPSLSRVPVESSNLRYLDVRQCRRLTNRTLHILAERCTRLEVFLCESSEKISDDGVVALAKRCASLKSLQFQNTPNVTDLSISAIAQNCHALTSLSLIGCSIGDASMLALAKGCKNMERVRLQSKKVTDAGVLALVEANGLSLVELCLGKVSLTNDGLTRLGVSTDLEIFELYKCDSITETGVASFVSESRKLKSINIWGNRQMEDDIKSVEAALDLKRRVEIERRAKQLEAAANTTGGGISGGSSSGSPGSGRGSWLFKRIIGRG